MKRLPIPEDVTGEEIDKDVRQELLSLPKTLAEDVARNLVMVARLIDEDPEGAYGYSRVALRLASRVAAVREAAGFAAYATQKYSEALGEFRAARRMTGNTELWPVMADCERGLGRPEKALDMAGEPEVHKLDKAGQVEMRLVAAGARRDLGQTEAAIVTLQSPELASNSVQPWTARLRYAYADALLEAGREDEAREWFAKAVESDKDGSTDASDRLAELDGVEFTDALGDEEEPGFETGDEDAEAGGREAADVTPTASAGTDAALDESTDEDLVEVEDVVETAGADHLADADDAVIGEDAPDSGDASGDASGDTSADDGSASADPDGDPDGDSGIDAPGTDNSRNHMDH
ncbi:tetratricopeptide repeat protein [Streptomyces physcomitrii]|uniref:tetratricopeptide repeat protein n=1 Tax=Streptomyces physcomitrii TaxID=2724184 RepID=UPI0028A9AD50|nr:tetratricopeptide repeat protein [Streptomyces physcomitrii]